MFRTKPQNLDGKSVVRTANSTDLRDWEETETKNTIIFLLLYPALPPDGRRRLLAVARRAAGSVALVLEGARRARPAAAAPSARLVPRPAMQFIFDAILG